MHVVCQAIIRAVLRESSEALGIPLLISTQEQPVHCAK
jgi:hypothetical protein